LAFRAQRELLEIIERLLVAMRETTFLRDYQPQEASRLQALRMDIRH